MSAVLMPTTRPVRLRSGPPEFPGLMAASVWIRLWRIGRPGSSIERPRPLTTPAVTVGPPSIHCELCRVCQRQRWQFKRFDLENGEIGEAIASDERGTKRPLVGQRDLDLL